MGGPKVGVAPDKNGNFGQTPSSRLPPAFWCFPGFLQPPEMGTLGGAFEEKTEDITRLLTALQNLQCSVELLPLFFTVETQLFLSSVLKGR